MRRPRNFAVQCRRLNPAQLDFAAAEEVPPETVAGVMSAMEELDGLSQQFAFCKPYRSPERVRQFVRSFLASPQFAAVRNS